MCIISCIVCYIRCMVFCFHQDDSTNLVCFSSFPHCVFYHPHICVNNDYQFVVFDLIPTHPLRRQLISSMLISLLEHTLSTLDLSP